MTRIFILLLFTVATALAQDVPGHRITTRAVGLTNGVSVDVDASGDIWIGHEDNGAPTMIWKVGAGAPLGAGAQLYGDTNLPDPDVAIFDPVGLASGVAGSVLIGGACSGQGCIWAVRPDGTTLVCVQSTLFTNCSGFAMAPSGALYFAGGADGTVGVNYAPGLVAILDTLPVATQDVALDSANPNRLFVVGGDGVVRLYDLAAGTSAAYATLPFSGPASMAVDDQGLFGGDLYVLEGGPGGRLCRVGAGGVVSTAGTGFHGSGLDFGPDGALYVTHRPLPTAGTTELLRIAPPTAGPFAPGYTIDTWATGPVNGVSLSFSPAGDLFVGHEDNGTSTMIWRIDGGASPRTASLFGDTALPDPDTAVYDPFGLVSGVAGSVLVGGACAGQGCLWAVRPNGATVTCVQSSQFTNCSDMVLSSTGVLYMASGSDGGILEGPSAGQMNPLFTLPAASHSLDLDPSDETLLLTLADDGKIRICDLVTGAGTPFATMPFSGRPGTMRFARGGAFGDDLYVLEGGAGGALYRVDASGAPEVIATGLNASGMTFGPDGAIHVTHRPVPSAGTTVVLRIMPVDLPAWRLPYGQGIAGTNGVPGLDADGPPVIGSTFTLDFGNATGFPVTTVVVSGPARAMIPLPGGDLLVAPPWSADLLGVPVAGLTLPINVPANPALDGLFVCLQAFQPDPAAVGGLAASRGLELRFAP